MSPNHPPAEGGDSTRIGGLSDGVFSISLTLLVLDLKVPEIAANLGRAQAQAALDAALLALLPKLIFFALTFFMAGIYWMSHHRTFRFITRHNRTVQGLNLLFLAFVSLLPLSTGLLGYGSFREVWWIYCGNLMAMGLALVWLWRYAIAKGLTTPGLSAKEGDYFTARMLSVPAVFALSAVVAVFSLNLAQFTPLLLPLAFRLLERRYAHQD